jgi:hypothetical protein
MNLTQEISKYIHRNRKGQRQKVGILIAVKVNNIPVILWSLCKKEDKFNKVEARSVAFQRFDELEAGTELALTPVPNSINKDFKFFEARANRYFKIN